MIEPVPGHPPFPTNGRTGNLHHGCGLVFGKPREKAQLDDACHPGVYAAYSVQGVVQRDHVQRTFLVTNQCVVEWRSDPGAAAFARISPPGMIDQHQAHRLGGQGNQTTSIHLFVAQAASEPKKDLMDKRRGLQRVPPAFAA